MKNNLKLMKNTQKVFFFDNLLDFITFAKILKIINCKNQFIYIAKAN